MSCGCGLRLFDTVIKGKRARVAQLDSISRGESRLQTTFTQYRYTSREGLLSAATTALKILSAVA